jgi:hypothetical protein
VSTDGIIILDKPYQIDGYRKLMLRSALRLEVQGIRVWRHTTAYAIIKREFGFRGNKQKVYDAYSEQLRKEGVLS